MSLSIIDALDSPDLFRPHFRGDSWGPWRAFLAALFALTMDADDLALYQRHTGRQTPPAAAFTEAALVIGRRGGKSRVLALIAVFLACFRDYEPFLAPGEVATVAVIASTQRQARSIFRFVSGQLQAVPTLREMIVDETTDSIMLTNRVAIEITTASFRSTRGYTFAAALCDEISFWPQDENSANPDIEILRALRPGMANIPGSMLLLASSPYAKKGALYATYRQHFGKDDARVLVWQAATGDMNPRIDPAIIKEAYEADPEAAKAEYGALFRDDLADFVSREQVDAVTCWGRWESPPIPGVQYQAFVDPSGGVKDSMTMAIGHLSAEGTAVLDLVREIRPPFNPEEATAEMSGVLRLYDVSRVLGDRYAGEWVPARFKENGIHYEPSAKPKSQIYSDLLPMLTSGKVELLENVRLSAQLCGLERRTARGGRDSVDHPPGGHDDLINAVAGVLVMLDLDRRPAMIQQADLLTADQPATIEHPHAFMCTAWVTPDGQSAVALFSHEIAPDGGARIVLEWFDTAPWTPGLLLEASRRLDEFCDAAFTRSDAVKDRGGCAAFLMTQQELVQSAEAAMRTVFAAKLEVETYRRHGRTRNVNVLPIGPAYASNPARLSLGAAGHVAAGAVKLSAEALRLSGGKPLLGSLAVKPGEAVDANPLRMALLIGIAQLDPEWSAEDGAQVQFG